MSMPEVYLYFLFFSFLLFTGLKLIALIIKRPRSGNLKLDNVSVIIPFRNEENKLAQLLDSILKQKYFPNEILFVNDHSIDNSASIIESFIECHQIGILISLPNDFEGKKAALNYGIQKAKNRYILTLDADIVLSEDYFNSIQFIPNNGLHSLPVLMKGIGFFGRLFGTEYSFFNAFNYLLSPIWPISISGANLLFDSEIIDYKEQLESHHHIASGDDYFLLKEFRKNNLPIRMSNNYQSSVVTDAPNSWRYYFDQRVRWLSKSKHQIDWMDSLIGLFILVYFIGGFLALIAAVVNGQWILVSSIFVIRVLLDALVYLNYAQRLRETKNVLLLPFFQVIYPVLFLIVGVLALFYKPEWKGRSTLPIDISRESESESE